MNRVLWLGLGAVLLGCNESLEQVTLGMILPANVLWMEWPATVTVDQSYQFSGSVPDSTPARRFWVRGYLERATTSCAQGAADTLVFHLSTYSTSPN
jgi:hypothetical protein